MTPSADPRGRRTYRSHWTLALFTLLFLAGGTIVSCGSGADADRTDELCEACEPDIDRDCLRQCLRFCGDDETDEACAARCDRQCDDCKRDLVCAVCVGDCTGTIRRCARIDEVETCEDGRFGGPS